MRLRATFDGEGRFYAPGGAGVLRADGLSYELRTSKVVYRFGLDGSLQEIALGDGADPVGVVTQSVPVDVALYGCDRVRVITGLTVRDGDGIEQVVQPSQADVRTGNHYLNGVMIFWGNHIAPVGEVAPASIEDLTPTILHLLGQAVPQTLDGQVLTQVLTEGFRGDQPVRYQQEDEEDGKDARDVWDYEGKDLEEVEERLRGLGYL